jgi:uncharacterized membrane protein YfcA
VAGSRVPPAFRPSIQLLSGLLGIGSGALKVLAMDRIMRLPFKVSTTTSNFMIGVTATASAGIYLTRGYIDPTLAMPVMLGVLVSAALGSRILVTARAASLRVLLAVVMMALAAEMIVHGLAAGSELPPMRRGGCATGAKRTPTTPSWTS